MLICYSDLRHQDDSSILPNALAFLSSFITTISATSLIALKIVLVTRQSHQNYSYAKIIEILTQSAALVSIFLFVSSVVELLDYMHPFTLSTARGRFFIQVIGYLTYIQAPVTVCISQCCLIYSQQS